MRALVAGLVTLDRYGAESLPGGAAYYAGHALRALGARVRVLTAAGAEFPPEALAGLDVEVAAMAQTTRFVNSYGPGGRDQRVEAAGPALDPAALPAGWHEADLLHLAPVLGEVDLAAWRDAVPARFVGLEVQGWVRRVLPDGRVVPARWDPDKAVLAGVSAAVLGDDDVAADGDLPARLAEEIPVVAFTHGERGCELLLAGRRARVGAFRTSEVDPTGAGDVFAAALFLALARGQDPVAAARLGAAAASIAVEGRAGSTLHRLGEARGRTAGVLPG